MEDIEEFDEPLEDLSVEVPNDGEDNFQQIKNPWEIYFPGEELSPEDERMGIIDYFIHFFSQPEFQNEYSKVKLLKIVLLVF